MPEEVQDTIRLRGYLQMVVSRPDGSEKDRREAYNTVMLQGRSWFLYRAINTGTSPGCLDGYGIVCPVFIGTSNQAPNATDTFFGPVGGSAPTLSFVSYNTVILSGLSFSVIASNASGISAFTVREAGLYGVNFDTTPGLFNVCRATFADLPVATSDTFTITYALLG